MLQRTKIIIGALVVILVIAAVAAYFLLSTPPPAQRTLVYYSQYDIATLDPADAYDSGDFIPIQNSYDTLLTYPLTTIGSYAPGLAYLNYTISPDGLTYTFHLRPNVKFSNGDPMTADDVVYSFQRVIRMNGPQSGVGWIDTQDLNATSIKALGPLTVQFTLTHVFNPFLETLATVEPNGIVDKKVVEANGGIVNNQDNWWMFNNTIGTGPYMLQSWDKTHQIALVRNPYYWGPTSGLHYDKIVMLLNVATSTAISAARSGDATLADIPFTEAASLSNATNVNVVVSPVPRTYMVGFDINSTHTFMANASVRQALSWAFPYNQVISSAFQGYASPLNGPVPTQIYLGTESMPTKYYSYNLTKAAAILDAAGFTKNGQGLRFGGAGLTFYAISTQPWQPTVAQLYQASLSQIGVTLDIHSVLDTVRSATQKTNTWDLMIDTWGPDYNDPSDYALPFVGSAAIGGDTYHTVYANATIDNALTDAMTTTDLTREIADYHTVWTVQNVNPSLIYMVVAQHIAAVAKSLTNFTYNAIITYNFFFYLPSSSVGTSSLTVGAVDAPRALANSFGNLLNVCQRLLRA
jgi:peptide/nickel transport system substrate-binding protein